MAWALALMAEPVAVAQSPEERTRQALDMVLAGKYETFYAQFSPEMKKAIALQTYATQVSYIMTALGRPQSQDAPTARQVGDAATVTIPVHWSQATLNFTVSWNAAGQIQGTWFRSPEPPLPYYQAPSPDSLSSHDTSGAVEPLSLPPPAPPAPVCWSRIVKGTPQSQVESCLGKPTWTTSHRQWDWFPEWAPDGVAVRFDRRDKVTAFFYIAPAKDHKDHSEVWRAIGQTALGTYAAYECWRVRQKPLLWLTGNDLLWLQWCAQQGL
jgi:hypothetical protein